jgi:hypothetical protein
MTATPEDLTGTPDLGRTALEQLRLEGAIFFRSELTDPFSIDSTPNRVAGQVHAGAERIILFHIVHRGRCWVSGADGVRSIAETGDVIVVPYGDDHRISGQTPTTCAPLLDLLEPPPWKTIPVVEWGGAGPPTSLVCGYLVSDDPLFDPRLRVFPPVFVVRLPDASSKQWVEASIQYAMEGSVPATDGIAPTGVLATRLPELVLITVLQAHLATAPAADHGWLAALRDPVLAPALAQLHAAPERRWTVPASAAGPAVCAYQNQQPIPHVVGL